MEKQGFVYDLDLYDTVHDVFYRKILSQWGRWWTNAMIEICPMPEHSRRRFQNMHLIVSKLPPNLLDVFNRAAELERRQSTIRAVSKRHFEEFPGSPQGSFKRSKLAQPLIAYSCPFRKRNPRRFNIRDHSACAMSQFPDISKVK